LKTVEPRNKKNIVTCISDYRLVLDWMIGFNATLHTQLWTTGNYSAIADLHVSQFTVTHALGSSVFTSRNPDKEFITVSLSLQITYQVFFPPPFLALILRLSIPKTRLHSVPPPPSSHPGRLASRISTLHFWLLFSTLYSTTSSPLLIVSFYNTSARTTQKTQPLLLTRRVYPRYCLAINVLLFGAFAFAEMCLASRCLTMCIHVTI
jgi:hypothetical protein